jgi:hypothetical protein
MTFSLREHRAQPRVESRGGELASRDSRSLWTRRRQPSGRSDEVKQGRFAYPAEGGKAGTLHLHRAEDVKRGRFTYPAGEVKQGRFTYPADEVKRGRFTYLAGAKAGTLHLLRR